MNYFAFCFSPILFLSTFCTESNTTLAVEISNIKSAKGTIRMGVYKKGTKPTSRPDYPLVLALSGRSVERAAFQLPPGRYAFAAYHDLNNNQDLDTNIFGYPKEPFCFSNNFRPKFSAPDFEDCAFDVKQGGTTIRVKLK